MYGMEPVGVTDYRTLLSYFLINCVHVVTFTSMLANRERRLNLHKVPELPTCGMRQDGPLESTVINSLPAQCQGGWKQAELEEHANEEGSVQELVSFWWVAILSQRPGEDVWGLRGWNNWRKKSRAIFGTALWGLCAWNGGWGGGFVHGEPLAWWPWAQ